MQNFISSAKRSVIILLAFLVFYGQASSLYANTTMMLVTNSDEFQNALNNVADGGMIELAAGTYPAPTAGFNIPYDFDRGFSIRAAEGAIVTLDGQGKNPILKYHKNGIAASKLITISDITFTNGYADIGAAAKIEGANMVFVRCRFLHNQAKLYAGAVSLVSSVALFVDGTWDDNSATQWGGALGANDNATVYLYRATFTNNSAAKAGHSPTAAGGAVHLGNADGFISDSYFANNRAGYVGGAVFAIADFEAAARTLYIGNSVFEKNVAKAAYTTGFPSESGAVHAEANMTMKIYNSRFIENSAEIGGAINSYRAILEIENSVFLGNRATGTIPGRGMGGAISSNSNDRSDVADVVTNVRSAQLTIRSSYFQSRYGETIYGARGGGCVFSIGDTARQYGGQGVPVQQNLGLNRMKVVIQDSVFENCNSKVDSEGGPGGAILVDLVDLNIKNSLFLNSSAKGGYSGRGGAIEAIRESLLTVDGSTFAKNSAYSAGGALSSYGATIDVQNSYFINNETELRTDVWSSVGSTLFSSFYSDGTLKVDAAGNFHDNTISSTIGLPLYEYDNQVHPTNETIYNNNTIYSSFFGQGVYTHPIVGGGLPVSRLNTIVVRRNDGSQTDKSQIPNISQSSLPNLCAAKIAPAQITSANTNVYAAFAWSGAAMLQGSSVSGSTAIVPTTIDTFQTLQVANLTPCKVQATIANPEVNFVVNYPVVPPGNNVILSWSPKRNSSQPFATLFWTANQLVATTATKSQTVTVNQDVTYQVLQFFPQGGSLVSKTVRAATPGFTVTTSPKILLDLTTDSVTIDVQLRSNSGSVMQWQLVDYPNSLLPSSGAGILSETPAIVSFPLDLMRLPPLNLGEFDLQVYFGKDLKFTAIDQATDLQFDQNLNLPALVKAAQIYKVFLLVYR
jgi:hypothetical protein